MVRTEKITEQKYEVYFNSVFLGTFELGIDGSFYYKNIISNQHNSSYSLRVVADALDKINEPFDDIFKRNFEESARVEYRKLLNQKGIFFAWYPQLTGEYKKDKVEWLEIFKEMEVLRQDKITF